MKKLYILLVLGLFGFIGNAQIVNIPDANFKAKLLAASASNTIATNLSGYYFKIDANNDGVIQQSEALQVLNLDVHYTNIYSLDGISSFTNIVRLECYSNQISDIDVSALTHLQYFNCSHNQLQTLNMTGAVNLTTLNCASNDITDLTIINLTNLQYLDYGGNQLPNLNVNGLTNLTSLLCYYNQITDLNISNLTHLLYLDCDDNQLASLNVSASPNLQNLRCGGNQLSDLNVSGFTYLLDLDFSGNQISTINLSGLPNLNTLSCRYNTLTSLNVSGLANLIYLYCSDNQLPGINVSGLNNLLEIHCSNNPFTSLNLSGLPNLQYVDCSSDQLTSINVSGATGLQHLDCSSNLLPGITVSGLTSLQYLNCGSNQIPTINVSGLTNLQTLFCYTNQLPSLNVSGLTHLINLDFGENQIPTINLNGLTNLLYLGCASNLLSTLNLTGLTNINSLYCDNNLFTTLDLSSQSHLQTLYCESNNQLTTLLIKNGSIETDLDAYNNPNLQYICADEGQISDIQDGIDLGYFGSNCHVNSYCSFVPGGTFYTIQGNNRYDEDNNGCSPSDINYPNLKLSFTDGINSGNLIPNTSGAYRFDAQAGVQTFSPTLENPAYFIISPSTATVTFPTAISPHIQDFCISANGTHNDLEITLLPIDNAQSGFDAYYEIIYKNKGTNTQSGSINLVFNDTVLDYLSAVPAVDSQTVNNLTWNFSNLAPFETRVIDISLNLNSPIETPPLNSGDILNYTATAIGLTDETPADNTSILHQTVVNGLDPNDKTCIEGTTITPAMVGQYVHYIVHFENDGTASARNIVVKDMIDTTKFDISTLVPLRGSAPFTTRITNTNQVEFIFQNINLPFAAGTNKGYVAFKIKTKPTLVVGSTFSNTAGIYFDYNAPIVTNTATSTVTALATQDFDFGTYFNVYPNPVKQVLYLETKSTIGIKSINIYNMLGQMVIAIPNAESISAIDVSDLKTGTYFIKVNTDKGTANAKFIKE